MTAGAAVFGVGLAMWLASRFGVPLGRLPGDISWQGKNFRVYAPITSMLALSAVLTIVLNILARFIKK
jgi:hypothetical protein